jgi:hypothetical protein
VVIALVVTPAGFPLAYEILPGNKTDNTTLAGFLEKIEARYGQARRVWLMDRGIRRKKLRRLIGRLHELRGQLPDRDKLLMALGAAKKEAGRFYALLKITIPAADQAVSAETFSFRMDRARLRVVRRREGS